MRSYHRLTHAGAFEVTAGDLSEVPGRDLSFGDSVGLSGPFVKGSALKKKTKPWCLIIKQIS